jgi:cell division septation protein DedD
MAIGAMILSTAGCAEIEVSAEADKTIARASEPSPVLHGPARQDSIDPSLHPDPEAFHATGLALWDGTQTLPGIWIAHPMAETARRVRLTNGETGARVDAAMFRRDPGPSGPPIIVSSEAAERLGLTPGHDTEITIEGLAYRVDTEAATDTKAVVASAAEEPVPGPVELLAADVLVEEADGAPVEPEVMPVAASSPAPPAAPEPAAADAAGAGGTSPTPEEAQPVAGIPAPQPMARPAEPAPVPDGTGDIPDGRNFIQAGLFSQPEDAARLVEKLRAADLPANEFSLTVGARQFTRVLVGPFRTIAERDSALETVRKLGPADATPARG